MGRALLESLRLTPNLIHNSGRGIHHGSLLRSKKASSNTTDFDRGVKHTKKESVYPNNANHLVDIITQFRALRLDHVHNHLHGSYRVMVHHVFGGYPNDPDLPFDAKMGRWPIECRQPLLTRERYRCGQ